MIFKGVATALVTPFTEDDRVDVSALERIVEYQLEGNVDALVALGTTGEPATLSRKEKELVLKTVAKKRKAKSPSLSAQARTIQKAQSTTALLQKTTARTLC